LICDRKIRYQLTHPPPWHGFPHPLKTAAAIIIIIIIIIINNDNNNNKTLLEDCRLIVERGFARPMTRRAMLAGA
jgi:hypothetical protein